jgi:hypothetical protein
MGKCTRESGLASSAISAGASRWLWKTMIGPPLLVKNPARSRLSR